MPQLATDEVPPLAGGIEQDSLRPERREENMETRVGPQVEKSSNLHITADSTGSIHKYARGKKFDPKKVRLGCGDLI